MGMTFTNPGGTAIVTNAPSGTSTATITGVQSQNAPVVQTQTFWGGIQGTLSDQTDLQSALNGKTSDAEFLGHTTDFNNPHQTDKADVGLDQVQNIAPINMPVSNPTQTAINAAVTGPVPTITIQASQISDSTVDGRQVLTAASDAAIRAAIGATATGDGVFTAATPIAGRSALAVATQPTFRNLLDNALYQIDALAQGGVSGTGSRTFICDRWKFTATSTAGTVYQGARNSGAVQPGQVINAAMFVISGAAAPAATDFAMLSQTIEGTRFVDSKWGTAQARNIILTIEVWCTVAGTYSYAVRNQAASRSYVTPIVINNANTWETKVITIPGDQTAATWQADLRTVNPAINFNMCVTAGTTYSTTANSWQNGNFIGITGMTQLGANASAQFRQGNIQVEYDSQTAFEHLPFDMDQRRCQYFLYPALVGSGALFTTPIFQTVTANNWWTSCPLPGMRAVPSLFAFGSFITTGIGALQNVTGITILVPSIYAAGLTVTTSGSPPAVGLSSLIQGNSAGCAIAFSAEI